METKQAIIQLADKFIRDKGYNAFSFHDIAVALGIKNSSVHYHFPTKASLGLAVLRLHQASLEKFRSEHACTSPLTTFRNFLSIYAGIKQENRVCIVGSLAPDIHTLDPELVSALAAFADNTIIFLTEVLEEGLKQKIFFFRQEPRTKALTVLTSLLASLQLTRLTSEEDFNKIKETIISDILT